MTRILVFFLIIAYCLNTKVNAQPNAFSLGKWVKIATVQQGMHFLTGKQLKQGGFNLPLPSNLLQIWTMDATDLQTAVQIPIASNQQIALGIRDGGDGLFQESDSLLFYSKGLLQWEKTDTENYWQTHLTSTRDTVYYFLGLGENAKRIATNNLSDPLAPLVNQYISLQHFEKDSINLLNSGQQWLGPPMGNGMGKTNSIQLPFLLTGWKTGQPIAIKGNWMSAAYGSGASMSMVLDGVTIKTIPMPSITGILYDASAIAVEDSFEYTPPNNFNTLNAITRLDFSGTGNSTAWVDYVDMAIPKTLSFNNGNQLFFNIENTLPFANNWKIQIQNTDASTTVWDVSNPLEPINYIGSYSSNQFELIATQKPQALFGAVKQNGYLPAIFIDTLVPQDLHNLGQVDYVMICPPNFWEAATKLQAFHQSKNALKTVLIQPQQIYNEFSGGQTNPIGIRNFMFWLKEKAIANNYPAPQYLLLFGLSNFNCKKLDPNSQLPTYESIASNALLNTYASDDFYGILNAGENIHQPSSVNALSLAIGRLPVRSAANADSLVNKIIQYQLHPNRGIWQNQLTWIADDGDYNLHLQDAEEISQELKTKNAKWDQQKIYLDLYTAQSSTGGLRYPEANTILRQRVNEGSLLVNYTGHGNYMRLSEEAVITAAEIDSWDNSNRLPLLVTASCDFAPFDQPQLQPIGFDALSKNGKGIIGLVAASRLVFAYSNKQINNHFIQSLLVPDSNGSYLSIGKALQKAKKMNWHQNGDRLNAFKFNLMGDPALSLKAAQNKILFTHLNQAPIHQKDTLLAGNLTTLQAAVYKQNQINNSFNGLVEFIVWDAPKNKSSLGNNSTSMVTSVTTQETILFKGKATVQNGLFSLQFILPKEVQSMDLPIKIVALAYTDSSDAIGIADSLFVQSNRGQEFEDTLGPKMQAFINDTNFKQNDWVSNPAKLIIYLKDSAGIQSAGTSLGHDIVCIVDEDFQNPIVLNAFFLAAIDQYQSGKLQYSLPQFTIGKHRLIIKAWDILGNLSKDTLYFEVPASNQLQIKGLHNFPNPMSNTTFFSFETNQLDPVLSYVFNIRDINGQLLEEKTLYPSNHSNKIQFEWNGILRTGSMLPPGLYFYSLMVDNGKEKKILTNKLIKL